MAPVVEQLAGHYKHVAFCKVDVDVCEETAQAHEIEAMPTFLIFNKGVKVGSLEGANKAKLLDLVKQHAPAAPAPAGGGAAGNS